jgi:hypothetical protein
MVADLAGDPGGEAITKARKAQVELAAREPLAWLVASRWTTAAAGATQQQRTIRRSQTRRCAPINRSWVAVSWLVSALARTSSWRG